MKKIATRILALVVALSMLLASTAFAAERNAATLSVGNFEITVGEEPISLPVTLSIGGGVDLEGARGYLNAGLSTETAVALSALAALENGEIKAYLDGMNYGFSLSIEQIIALLEEELGMTMEEAMAELMTEASFMFDAETQAAITGMTDSIAALENVEIDPEAALAALGITLTEKEEATILLFDVETIATEVALTMEPRTGKEIIDAISSLDPALADYFTQYLAMLNQSLAESGEEMTIEEALAMTTFSMGGGIYEADCGAYAELLLTVTVEGESIDVPFTVTALEDETGVYTEISVAMDIDGEVAYISVYVDDFVHEGVDNGNFIVSFSIGDVDSEEADVEFAFALNRYDTHTEGFGVSANLAAVSYDDEVSFGFSYAGNPVVSTEAADSYDGVLNVYATVEGMTIDAYADTNLTLTNVPAGELLSLGDAAINPLEMDDATAEQIISDAQNALIQGLGVLMQDPAISSIIGGLLG